MCNQIELPFAVKKEEEAERNVISEAVVKKGELQSHIMKMYKELSSPNLSDNLILLEFNMVLTQVCNSKEFRPDDHRVYLRRISGALNVSGFNSKPNFTEYNDAVIPTWVDALFLKQNWVGRELLADTFRQIAGLKYANAIWDEIVRAVSVEQESRDDGKSLVVIKFNHALFPNEVIPSDTEAVIELIKEGENTFKFLKRKASNSGIILLGEYDNFFPADRFIRDVENRQLCDGYSFKKHFDTDFLLINNALSFFQTTSTKGWPNIIFPPDINDHDFALRHSESYFYAKWYHDDDFHCNEVVGKIDKSSLVNLASYFRKRSTKREKRKGRE